MQDHGVGPGSPPDLEGIPQGLEEGHCTWLLLGDVDFASERAR